MLVDAAHLRTRADNANTAILSDICQWLLLSTQQNDTAKKNRLKSFIKGPVGRHRIGWLDLVNSSEMPLPQKGTPSWSGAEPNSGKDLSSENLGKTRSLNISNLPDCMTTTIM
jgi:hypothetical protein